MTQKRKRLASQRFRIEFEVRGHDPLWISARELKQLSLTLSQRLEQTLKTKALLALDGVNHRYTRKALKTWQSAIRSGQATVLVVFLDASEMQDLNWQFRKKNKPTDVLSFAASEPDLMGELAVCAAVVRRQARDYRVPYREELSRMIIHGLLHLLGLDHEQSAAEDVCMTALQEHLLTALLTER